MPGIADETERLAAIIRQWLNYHPACGVSLRLVSKGVFVVVSEDGQPALLKRKDTFIEALLVVVDYIKKRDDPIDPEPRRVA